jgi:NAD(P)-dependent dehydrogenase (short-subunit alcohol dehydrogenase family)
MSDFKDKVVMITGAAGNLGSATARAFLQGGARLVLVDLRQERLEERFGDLQEEDAVFFAGVDLTDDGAVEGMVYEAVQQMGTIDVLANIAGGFRSGAPVHETSLDTWQYMLDLNARTVLVTARAVVPHMLQQKSGKIINIASRAALKGGAKSAAYAAAKSAVMRLTESMSAGLKEAGINVNCLIPGTIDTPQNRKSMPDADYAKWVEPQALADVILFLASEKARAVHGACVPVYGLT